VRAKTQSKSRVEEKKEKSNYGCKKSQPILHCTEKKGIARGQHTWEQQKSKKEISENPESTAKSRRLVENKLKSPVGQW